MITLNIPEAEAELNQKSYRDIQSETAAKWGARAAVSYQNVINAVAGNKLLFWTVAEEFNHEAIEHAALVEDGGELVGEIQDAVRPYQEAALDVLRAIFNVEKIDEVEEEVSDVPQSDESEEESEEKQEENNPEQ